MPHQSTHPALCLPIVDRPTVRRDVTYPEGSTIADIVALALPGLPAEMTARVRVALVTERGAIIVEPSRWPVVRPKAGVKVVIRSVPGGSNVWRSLLMIVVTIAAVALGQLWALPVSGALGISAAAATTLVTLGVTAIGMLLVNALIPIKRGGGDDQKEYGGYSAQGWRNGSDPDGPIPVPFGRLRMAPPYAAPPYTEIVGDIQYLRAIFVWGYGPLALSDLKFGETSIGQYDEVEIEHRYGWPGDEQLTLYTQQVIEEGLNVDLTKAWERNDDGSYKSGGTTIVKPVVRYTATDVTEAAVIVGFPGGLYSMSDNGGRQNFQVDIRIRQRPLGATDWTDVTTLSIVAAKSVPFWRQHRWTLPSRGAWEIELTRMTDETKSSSVGDRAVWQALQSFRPEYPVAFEHPLALTAIRVKATYQLNGTLDNFSGVASRIAPDWDVVTGTWITRETRSPAAAYRWMLEGPAAAYPSDPTALDLDAIADWSAYCTAKGLRYDRVHAQGESLADALGYATHAGRAQPRHDGRCWSVVVDRPQTLVVDHINPRNSRDLQWTRVYPRRPDAFRIKFQDASNDWKTSERIVPWPGHVGDVVVTEQLDLPGKTDAGEIFLEARRRQHEIDLRPDTIRVTQDGAARVATRGDLVAVSHDVLARTQVAARVRAVIGPLLDLDDVVTMEAGGDYAVRYRVFADDDTIGTSIVRQVATVAGDTRSVRLIGDGPLPAPDDIVHFGPRSTESLLAIVRSEERGEDGAVIYHVVAAAPEIDALVDATEPPAWDGRAGATYTGGGATPAPMAPVITSIQTGAAGTGDPNGLAVHLEPGAGSAAVVARFQIQHRLQGSASWVTRTVTAASGGAEITGYVTGQTIELRARAVSIYDVVGPNTAVVSVTIGAADAVVMPVTALSAVRLASGARRYTVDIAGRDDTIVGYRLRGRPGSGWSWADLGPLHSGFLSASPAELSEPLVAGTYTIAAVAVDRTGTESRIPLAITTTLGSSAPATLAQRLEAGLGWPGTVTGAAVSSGELVGSAAPSLITYVQPVIDLGSDMAAVIAVDVFGVVGDAVVTMRTGFSAAGGVTGAARPLGAVTARWIQITVTVTTASGSGRLGDLATLVASA